jgi:hypothetical protein
MAADFIASLGAVKTAFDLARGLKDINDAALRNAAVIELQEKILAAQAAQLDLVQRVNDLENDLARLKTWEAEKERYELKQVAPGAMVYVPKESLRGDEPIHWLCANCFQNGKKRFLQESRGDASFVYHKCQECGGEIRIRKPPSPPRQAIATTRYDPFGRR